MQTGSTPITIGTSPQTEVPYLHRRFLHNDTLHDIADPVLAAGQAGLLNGWGVFTTFRVDDGVLFAYDRHWARMERDARIYGIPFNVDPGLVQSRLARLIEANQAYTATLRLAFVRNLGGQFFDDAQNRPLDMIAFTTNRKQWGESVSLGLLPDARHAGSAFAGTKMLSWSHNLTMLEQAQARGFDEVVLLNERGEVSECTSANIFAMFGSRAVTPPLSSGGLPGITRAVILEEIRVPGMEIAEAVLMPADLEAADEVFITSSTRELLPVRAIDGLNIRYGRTRQAGLLAAFQAFAAEYTTRHRAAQELVR